MAKVSILWQRAAVIGAVRRFFQDRSYLEVETPARLPSLIPESYIEPEEAAGWYLQTSPEICMKRLLSRGIPRIFQICRCFRRHERGRRHLPEFTMLEWYRAGADYGDLMTECEELFAFLVAALDREARVKVGGRQVTLERPWERLTVKEAFRRFAPFSLAEALAVEIFDETLVRHVEPCLGLERPCLLYDYPASQGSLARLKGKDPGVAERFELFVGGLELANGFSELTDVNEQRQRFQAARKAIGAQGRDVGSMPEPFLEDLARMPEAAGIALGLDRLVMLFAEVERIDEAVAFTPEEL